MLVYNIGLSAIRANQVALQTISNNIANAATDGYKRQRVNLVESNPITQGNLQFGTGVTVQSVERIRSASVENALSLNLSHSADAQAGLDALREIERLLTPSEGSLQSQVANFFNQVERLAAQPAEDIIRREVLVAARGVAQEITAINGSLDHLQDSLASDVVETVARINEITSNLANLNVQIRQAQATGIQPNTLLDQRDKLVQELATLVDISPASLANEQSPLVAAGGWLVVGERPPVLSVQRAEDGSLQISIGSGQGPVVPVSGKLAGLLTAHNEVVPQTRDALQEWTSAFISGVDAVQATGLGLTGPQAILAGSRGIADANVPLAQSDALFPIRAGDLYISVTDTATGVRTTHKISIDPASDSLNDVISQINAVAHVQASLQTGSNKVRMVADPGYAIDFAGRPDSVVDTSGMTGTARPAFSGLYEGAANSNWTVTALSDGEIGVTPGLLLRVTDSTTGAVIADLDVGSGYQANQPLVIADGISLQLSSGTLAGGDSFSIQNVRDPDTAGILTALGIGTLFETSDLRSVAVNQTVLDHPELLAASRTGEIGDAGQLTRLVELRSARILAGGTQTLEDRLTALTSQTGVAVRSQQARVDQLLVQSNQLKDQQAAISGVDPNEELLLMLEFQRAFQANAQFIASVNEALDQLLTLV